MTVLAALAQVERLDAYAPSVHCKNALYWLIQCLSFLQSRQVRLQLVPDTRNGCGPPLILRFQIALPFLFFNRCQDSQVLGLPDGFGIGPLISFIAIQFSVM